MQEKSVTGYPSLYFPSPEYVMELVVTPLFVSQSMLTPTENVWLFWSHVLPKDLASLL